MQAKTFVLGSSGLISLTEAYDGEYNPKAQYKVTAISNISAMSALGLSVFDEVYSPYGLSEETFATDEANKVDIITLENNLLGALIVPSSQITKMVDQTTVPYHQAIIAVSLGAMPDSYDYTNFKAELVQFCSDVSGVSEGIEAKLGVIDIADSVTMEQHITMETNRKNNVKNRTNSRGRELALIEENKALKLKLKRYSEILVANGYIPTA